MSTIKALSCVLNYQICGVSNSFQLFAVDLFNFYFSPLKCNFIDPNLGRAASDSGKVMPTCDCKLHRRMRENHAEKLNEKIKNCSSSHEVDSRAE